MGGIVRREGIWGGGERYIGGERLGMRGCEGMGRKEMLM